MRWLPRLLVCLSIASAQTALLAQTGALYHFDEGGGATAHDSVGSHDGQIAGATFVPGVSGTALHFPAGSSLSRVDLPQSVFDGFGNSFYVQAWVRPQAYSPSSALCCETEIVRKRALFNDWAMALTSGGNLDCYAGTIGTNCLISPPVPLNVWTKVACGYDGSVLRAWINDQQVAAIPAVTQLDWRGSYVQTQIGNNTYDYGINCGDYGFVGDIDELEILPSRPAPPPGCSFGPTAQPIVVTRSTGAPVVRPVIWTSCGGKGTLQIELTRVSSATLTLNGRTLLGPSAFKKNDHHLALDVTLLQGANELDVELRGEPGSSMAITLGGPGEPPE